jgi:hypothetical protein
MPLETYRDFADRDPLSRLVLKQLLATVLDPPLRADPRAGRRGGGGRGALDVEVGGEPQARGARPGRTWKRS